MYRYPYATLYAILTVIISYPVFRICNMLCRWIREALIELFPRFFHDYSPVLEIREYESAMLAVTLIASVLSLFIVTMIVTRLDNERDEFIIRKTEGFYRITGVMPLYYRTYILPDLVASAVVTALTSLVIIPCYSIKENRASGFEPTLVRFRESHLGLLFDKLDYPVAIITIFALVFTFKVISGIYGLKKWRAAWLAYN